MSAFSVHAAYPLDDRDALDKLFREDHLAWEKMGKAAQSLVHCFTCFHSRFSLIGLATTGVVGVALLLKTMKRCTSDQERTGKA
ncbi:MAG TPA: hypothetical protein VN957_19180 [Chthoniobacterales bacterium]|jgi:hypothetical protein|nr:hypothetical protein [Chthoniobacterales bacterium]